jgi:hypothetical protein
MTRLYLSADAAALAALRDGAAVSLVAYVAAGDDEQDEADALAAAAEDGQVALAAEVDDVAEGDEQEVTLEQVDAIHLDVDGSGDLAWYATQEIEEVLRLLA